MTIQEDYFALTPIDRPTVGPRPPRPADTWAIAQRAAKTSASILLLGESGTGKSCLARRIHEESPRANRPFVTVSCPCLSRELLESDLFGHVRGSFTGATTDTWGKVHAAEGGTLFLDEIGELPLDLQPKLLRLLQDREYERIGETKVRQAQIRIIAATNTDLAAAVDDGRFREDLFYRLSVISLELQPLRERTGEIQKFAEMFLTELAEQHGKPGLTFSPLALERIIAFSWPGNLRQLRNAIEHAVVLTDALAIEPDDLPDFLLNTAIPQAASVGTSRSLASIEADHIRAILSRTRTLAEAARVLNIDPSTLYRKRKRLERDGLLQAAA